MRALKLGNYYSSKGFTLGKTKNILGGTLVHITENIETDSKCECPHCHEEACYSTMSAPREYKESKLLTGKPAVVIAERAIYRCTKCGKRFTAPNALFHNSNLTSACVQSILYFSNLGLSNTDVATATGVDESTVRRYKKNKDKVQAL